jgi:hypothetical protein
MQLLFKSRRDVAQRSCSARSDYQAMSDVETWLPEGQGLYGMRVVVAPVAWKLLVGAPPVSLSFRQTGRHMVQRLLAAPSLELCSLYRLVLAGCKRETKLALQSYLARCCAPGWGPPASLPAESPRRQP